jgi:SPOR domain
VSTTTSPPTPTLGGEGEVCADCGSPLASDQRYCLQCGARRGESRVPVALVPGRTSGEGAGPPPQGRRPAGGGEWTPLTALGLVGLIALILVAGVLIGRGIDGSGDPAQVVQAGGTGSTGATAVADTGGSFKGDWPSGKEGFTVELGSLPKDGSSAADVKAAKDDATGKGATKVGALDSDEFASLPGGKYVLYSGVYGSKAAAGKALAKLKGDFPDARVVKISTSSGGGSSEASTDTGGSTGTVDKSKLNDLAGKSGDDYVKESKKLPDNTVLPGKPPPKDNKAAGGGTPAVEF